MCVQMSSGRDGARLLIMKLQITKSNYSPISSQKILCPELPSPPLYLAFSLSSIPRFFFFFLHFSLSVSVSLSPHHALPPLPGAAADRMTSPPSLVDCSIRKLNVYVLYVRVCVSVPEISIQVTEILCNGRLKGSSLAKEIDCVRVCVCVSGEETGIVKHEWEDTRAESRLSPSLNCL